jgi:hypothetical protein
MLFPWLRLARNENNEIPVATRPIEEIPFRLPNSSDSEKLKFGPKNG